jgi:hypothetical protein
LRNPEGVLTSIAEALKERGFKETAEEEAEAESRS